MSISRESDFKGMAGVSHAVAHTLKEMQARAVPGITTKELDDLGDAILKSFGARSAPRLTYNFPGATCISVNEAFCHGIPSSNTVLKQGDLVNIDVSAELDGYWSDNGASFVIGNDVNKHQSLVDASKLILVAAIDQIKGGVKIAELGGWIEHRAKQFGFKVIRNLTGHGVGRSLHEHPSYIANYRDSSNAQRFTKNSVVAIETFIATTSSMAVTAGDGWTLVGNRGGFMAQHEHTIVVTDGKPIILTADNGIS
ncbi:MAG: type I methionyl aminopeptidase [Chryseolinea sp.]